MPGGEDCGGGTRRCVYARDAGSKALCGCAAGARCQEEPRGKQKFCFALSMLFLFGIFSGDGSEGLDCFQLIFYLLSRCSFEHSTELRLGQEAAIFILFAEESELHGPRCSGGLNKGGIQRRCLIDIGNGSYYCVGYRLCSQRLQAKVTSGSMSSALASSHYNESSIILHANWE